MDDILTEYALRGVWGADYEKKLRQSARCARDIGGEPFLVWLEETRLGNNASVICAFQKLAEVLDAPPKPEVQPQQRAILATTEDSNAG